VSKLNENPLIRDFLGLDCEASISSAPRAHLDYLWMTGTEGKGNGYGGKGAIL
jgi:hypothetical protein